MFGIDRQATGYTDDSVYRAVPYPGLDTSEAGAVVGSGRRSVAMQYCRLQFKLCSFLTFGARIVMHSLTKQRELLTRTILQREDKPE